MAQIPKLKRERERIIMRCSHFGSLLVRSEQVKLWGPQQRRRSVYPTNWRTVAPASCLVHEVVERLRPAALQQTRCEGTLSNLRDNHFRLLRREQEASLCWGAWGWVGGVGVVSHCFGGPMGQGFGSTQWMHLLLGPGPWTLDPLPICLLGQVLFLYSQLFMGWLQLSDLATIQIHGHIKWQK